MRFRVHTALLLLLTFCCSQLILAQHSEYLFKVVFFESVADYIEWPKEVNMSDQVTTFVIKTYDKDSFNGMLDKSYSNQQIKSLPVAVDHINKFDQIETCHILFISRISGSKLSELLKELEGKPILTISDTPGYAKKGVMINMIVQQNNNYYEINEKSANLAGFKFDPYFKNFAKSIFPKKSIIP